MDSCQNNTLEGLTDNDKASEISMDTNNYYGNCIFKKNCDFYNLYKQNYNNYF